MPEKPATTTAVSEQASELWTIQRVLVWTQAHFRDKGIESARLDAELLLASVLGKDRVYLYTHNEQPLSAVERDAYRTLVKRRAQREPVAYILGQREFYGRTFTVSPAVLVPRPETEHLVEEVLGWVRRHGLEAPEILDIGTGSGCIATTLLCELPQARLVATDVSPAALVVARRNAERHDVAARIELLAGDLFAPLTGRVFDVIVSNPPYVDPATESSLPPDVRAFEPHLALFAADAGLAVLSRLCREAPALLATPGLLACEIGAGQKDAVAAMADVAAGFATTSFVPDLQKIPRVLLAEKGAAS
ncbi:MAG: peptide chain release factor N(5)-glutamine methyltransferase [Deltaproteobacteria bacterium]|nr:peptide chain release factor N(5)-glutamine methyltransferase [Deltaproteobacteria bacterium]